MGKLTNRVLADMGVWVRDDIEPTVSLRLTRAELVMIEGGLELYEDGLGETNDLRARIGAAIEGMG